MKPLLWNAWNAHFRFPMLPVLVPPRGRKNAWTMPFLVPLRGQNENSRRASPTFLYGSPPPGLLYIHHGFTLAIRSKHHTQFIISYYHDSLGSHLFFVAVFSNLLRTHWCSAHRTTAENNWFSRIPSVSLWRTAHNVPLSMSVNPSALNASAVFLSMHSKQRVANWDSSNKRAWLSSMKALSALRFVFRKSTQAFSRVGTAYFLAA